MVTNGLVLGLFLGLFTYSEASHFRGGQITWKADPANPLNVRIRLRLGWRRDDPKPICDDALIASQTLTGYDEYVTCVSGCMGQVMSTKIYCTEFSDGENWMVGEREANYTFPGPAGVYKIEYSGRAWINNMAVGSGGDWSLQATIDLRPRNDTGKVNKSPPVASQLVFRINRQCDRQEVIKIPTVDADGDIVRCRWASGQAECGAVCNGFPGAILDEANCELRVNARSLQDTWYAVAIMVEDFMPGSSAPLSSTPLQFLVNGYTGTTCNRPGFGPSTPAFGEVFYFDTNCPGPFRFDVIMAPELRSDSIQEVSVIGRRGITKGAVTPLNNAENESSVTVSWTPPREDDYEIIAIVAKDQNGMATAQTAVLIRTFKNSADVPNQCRGEPNCQYCGQPSALLPNGASVSSVLACWSKCLCP